MKGMGFLKKELPCRVPLEGHFQDEVASSLQQSQLQSARPSLSLMGNTCSSSRLCGTVRGRFTLSLFSSRGSQKTGEWMQGIVNSAYLHHVPHTMNIDACQRI